MSLKAIEAHSGNRNGSVLGGINPRLAPTEWPTRDDIIWAAGIYEGEGSVRKSATEMVVVGQADEWLPTRLRALFGGNVYKRDFRRIKPHWKDQWAWTITGPRARGFLMSIYGLLSPRRQEQILAAFKKPSPNQKRKSSSGKGA